MYRIPFLALISLLITGSLFLSGCAYHFGLSERGLPGGYTQVAVPIFKNKSPEVGIEPFFTNSLIRRFARSQVARVTDKESAPVTLEGTILTVKTFSGAAKPSNELTTLPQDTVITIEYRLVVTISVVLKRKSDEKIIWEGNFANEKVYAPPRLGTAIVNSANATFNQSARMETISRLADEMMAEAHDRITENF